MTYITYNIDRKRGDVMEWLKKRRIDLNYTQQEIANQIGVKVRQYIRYEQGETEIGKMGFDTALKLSRVLHLSFDRFVKLYEENK
jgi:transcriptional regulator with XRE-family HTH domain